jgi:hypothetical protein
VGKRTGFGRARHRTSASRRAQEPDCERLPMHFGDLDAEILQLGRSGLDLI